MESDPGLFFQWAIHCVVPENVLPPPRMVFPLNPSPLWKFQFQMHTSLYKLLVFETPTRHPPSEFLRTIRWVGMDILLSHTFEGHFCVRSDFPHCLHVDYIKCSQHANKIFVQEILCHMFSSVSLGQVSGKIPCYGQVFL